MAPGGGTTFAAPHPPEHGYPITDNSHYVAHLLADLGRTFQFVLPPAKHPVADEAGCQRSSLAWIGHRVVHDHEPGVAPGLAVLRVDGMTDDCPAIPA